MPFIPLTEEDKKSMLESVGAESVRELFADIPDSIKLDENHDLPARMTEMQIERHMKDVTGKNKLARAFLGAGAYNHYIPAAVDHLSSRSEFYTAYTPYQPEVSQGTLTAIFEFQTMMCRLTGMDVSNASMYDGATALAESVLMVAGSTRKKKFLVSNAVHPQYRHVLETYTWSADLEIEEVGCSDGVTKAENIDSLIDDNTGAVIVQYPNFFGSIEDLTAIAEVVHNKKCLLIVVVTEAMSLALLKAPGKAGADIVCGEAQSFGNSIAYGGPMLGFISVNKPFMRRIPGRLAGQTTDDDGKEAYVLTLQTREQHIRREKATSNICSNEGLIALRAVMYLSLMGNKLRDVAALNHTMASYLKEKLAEKGFETVFSAPYFNEFVIKINDVKSIMAKMKNEGYVPGLYLGDYYEDLKDCILVCVTETSTPGDIDEFIKVLEEVI